MSNRQSAPVPREVSEAIRNARQARGLSRDAAARAAGVSVSLWTQVELGTQYKGEKKVDARTTARTLQAMAEAVGVDPVPLLRKTGLTRPATIATSTSRPAPLLDLSGLSEEDLSKVAAFVAGLRAR
ncbi:helix-turn-helix protein [Nocardia tenerifensis]|uniref:Helix-turn-helix protein n=1 Tax=Nocardia tenerifensis TaxID=228006 RepID=A0A318JLB9_9NOCA|nr:helix-turn-helix transcriptional regulator [Nocardia tenerifensis]PXX52652.1 helix-turn-helix protein [Nocardia tenerifensis]